MDGSFPTESWGATGDPAVILRQDLLSLRREAGPVHVVLVLPEDVDVLPFLVELWRARIAGGPLRDRFDAAPVMVGLAPTSFMKEIGHVRRSVQLWNGREHREGVRAAEAAARQVEAADTLIVSPDRTDDGEQTSAATAVASHLNPRAELVAPEGDPRTGLARPAPFDRPLPADFEEEWRARLEPVIVPHARQGCDFGVESIPWRARRPLHPGRLADALSVVMRGVVRGRGHLWLCNHPESVLAWRSAGPYLELRERDRWLEPTASDAWAAASPQRRTLAAWFWHEYYGERRNELVLTGVGLEKAVIHDTLSSALLTDAELSLGSAGWAAVPDPLMGGSGTR
ncbi:GTP-binding protein [Streptomyces sp. NPDC058374]|uniref:GTP-binding protein n=1 Tax=unclassified Streptomyces TaxID=2593676 RepID=UPI0036588D57